MSPSHSETSARNHGPRSGMMGSNPPGEGPAVSRARAGDRRNFALRRYEPGLVRGLLMKPTVLRGSRRQGICCTSTPHYPAAKSKREQARYATGNPDACGPIPTQTRPRARFARRTCAVPPSNAQSRPPAVAQRKAFRITGRLFVFGCGRENVPGTGCACGGTWDRDRRDGFLPIAPTPTAHTSPR